MNFLSLKVIFEFKTFYNFFFFSILLKSMDPRFQKYLYIIAFLALIVAMLTIYEGLNEINIFFNERIKI